MENEDNCLHQLHKKKGFFYLFYILFLRNEKHTFLSERLNIHTTKNPIKKNDLEQLSAHFIINAIFCGMIIQPLR